MYEVLKSLNYPNKTGLTYVNDFTFIIAILLSAQSKDEFVNSQTKDFFKKYDTPEKLSLLSLNEIKGYIKKIGLYNNKGESIYKLCKQTLELKRIKESLQEQEWFDKIKKNNKDFVLHGPIINQEGLPGFVYGLMQLAGVGRKSANVFLNNKYQAKLIGVDTHVMRVTNRLGLVNSKNPNTIEQELYNIVPEKETASFHNYIVWHGRFVCKAIKPKCESCALRQFCAFYKLNNKI